MSPPFLPEKKDGDADRVRDCGYGDDLHCKTQWAWHVDNRGDSEKNRGQRDSSAADRCNAQPDRSFGTKRTSTKNGYCEHREVNDPVENIRRVIHKWKSFLNAAAVLAHDGEYQRD